MGETEGKINRLHAVSRIKQGRQREPSVKTFRSLLSAQLCRHYVLSGGTQGRALKVKSFFSFNIT